MDQIVRKGKLNWNEVFCIQTINRFGGVKCQILNQVEQNLFLERVLQYLEEGVLPFFIGDAEECGQGFCRTGFAKLL